MRTLYPRPFGCSPQAQLAGSSIGSDGSLLINCTCDHFDYIAISVKHNKLQLVTNLLGEDAW